MRSERVPLEAAWRHIVIPAQTNTRSKATKSALQIVDDVVSAVTGGEPPARLTMWSRSTNAATSTTAAPTTRPQFLPTRRGTM